MKTTTSSIVLFCGLMGAASAASLSATDRKFLEHDAQGGLYEMQLSQLALDKSSDAKIKQFAQQDIADHTALQHQAEQIATQTGVSLPTTLASGKQAQLAQIGTLSGATFDKAFVAAMKSINTADKSDYKDELQSTSDTQMKAFVQQGQALDTKHKAIVETL